MRRALPKTFYLFVILATIYAAMELGALTSCLIDYFLLLLACANLPKAHLSITA